MSLELALLVLGVVLIVGGNPISSAVCRMIHAHDHLDLHKMGRAYDTCVERLITNTLLLPRGLATRIAGLALVLVAIRVFVLRM